jgi:RNA:NAD 2'-phosphotransferase (TPT1/KptA family)
MKDRHTRISLFLSPALRRRPEQVGIALAREITFIGDSRR